MGKNSDIHQLAKILIQLKAGQVVYIATSPKENCGEEYAATIIDLFDAKMIYINARNGGGHHFVKDVTVYDEVKTTRELAEELDEYLITGSFWGSYELDYMLAEHAVNVRCSECGNEAGLSQNHG